MMRTFLLLFAIVVCATSSTQATEIERNPNKRKGAGAPFQIRREKKWGYMDRRGKIIIEPQFDSEGDFFHGLAPVLKNGKWGYINEKAEQVIPFTFDDALEFTGDIAPVRVGRKWGYIDLGGRWIVSPQFQAAAEYINGSARVLLWDSIRCSRIYTKENAPEYVFVMPTIETALTSGCFPVDPKYGFIDKSGQFTVKPELLSAEDFSEGLAAFTVREQDKYKVGYIDLKGNVVIAPQFRGADSFSDGLAAAQLNDKWGYIDKSGKWVIEPRFAFAGTFSEGLARVEIAIGKGHGYINRTGQIIIKPQFEEAWDFSEGLAPVSKDNEWRFIDKTGKTVLKLKRARWGFSDGLTVAGEPPKRVYVDMQGRVVAQYEIGWGF